jgi:hypothetical protein
MYRLDIEEASYTRCPHGRVQLRATILPHASGSNSPPTADREDFVRKHIAHNIGRASPLVTYQKTTLLGKGGVVLTACMRSLISACVSGLTILWQEFNSAAQTEHTPQHKFAICFSCIPVNQCATPRRDRTHMSINLGSTLTVIERTTSKLVTFSLISMVNSNNLRSLFIKHAAYPSVIISTHVFEARDMTDKR